MISCLYLTSDSKKRKMSEALSTALVKTPPKMAKKETNVSAEKCEESDDNLDTIRELLQLTPEQEKEFFSEIFNEEIEMPLTEESKQKSIVPTVTYNSNSNIQNMPLTNRLLPKMMFANSNITINFNMK